MEAEPSPPSHTYRRIVCLSCGFTFDVPIYCGNRFCNTCARPRLRRIRAKLNALLTSVRPSPGYSIKFLTLTIPNTPDLRAAHLILLRSFRRLRQRALWNRRVRGGAYVLELTGNPSSWHLHLHAIIESRYIPVKQLSRTFEKAGGGRIVWITRIPPHAASLYLTKYLTKSSLPLDSQREASLALAGARLFQPFGSWHDLSLSLPKVHYVCPRCNSVAWSDLDTLVHKFKTWGYPFT